MKYIELEGSLYQIGFQHGSALRKEIRAVFDQYCRVDLKEKHLRRKTAIENTTREVFPEIIEEIQGIADGCGMSFEEMFLRNVVINLWLRSAPDSHCTCLALVDEKNGPLLGKNNDLETHEGDPMVLKKITLPTKMKLFSYSHIGTVWGGDGINSAGLAMGMTSVGTRYKVPFTGVPIVFLLYELLKRCEDLTSLQKELQAEPTLGKGYNLLAVDRGDTLRVFELACPRARVRRPHNGSSCVFCTNTYQHPELRHKDARTPVQKRNAEARYGSLVHSLRSASHHDLATMKGILASHRSPGRICQHDQDGLTTVGSYIAIPRKGKLLFCSGHPCRGKYKEYRL